MLPASSFLRLPLEIRDLIFENLLVLRPFPNSSSSIPLGDHNGFLEPRLPVALLRVNKQINEEASRVLYGENIFCITVNGNSKLTDFSNCGSDACAGSGKACWVHARNLALVRNLHMNVFSYYNRGQDMTTFQNLAKICRIFGNSPPLMTVTVKYQMLLGEEAAVEKPDDANVIVNRLRGHTNYENSKLIGHHFADPRNQQFHKIFLALTLLRSTRSVSIQPHLYDAYSYTSFEHMLLEPLFVPPSLTQEYAHFLEDSMLVQPLDHKKGGEDGDGDAYDSGVDL